MSSDYEDGLEATECKFDIEIAKKDCLGKFELNGNNYETFLGCWGMWDRYSIVIIKNDNENRMELNYKLGLDLDSIKKEIIKEVF